MAQDLKKQVITLLQSTRARIKSAEEEAMAESEAARDNAVLSSEGADQYYEGKSAAFYELLVILDNLIATVKTL